MSLETTELISVAQITVPTNKLVHHSLDIILRDQLRDEFEGTCNQHGFVKKISQIKYVGHGKIVSGADSCPVTFPIAYSASIVNIRKNDLIFGARIIMIEEFGIVCTTKESIVDIVIKSTDLPENYQSQFQINDIINVRSQIDGNFTIRGNKIYTIGTLHYYTVHDSLDNLCKFSLSQDDNPLPQLEIRASPKPALQFFGVDQKFEEFKNTSPMYKHKRYRTVRDILNPYELLWPSEYYQKFSKKHTVPKIQAISRAYFKMWEILKVFTKLVNIEDKQFVSSNLAEGPGGFIQAILDYREKYSPNHAKDKFYGLTLPSENTAVVPKFDQEFINKHSGKKLFIEYGNLTVPSEIKGYVAKFNKNKANIVTGDAGFPFAVISGVGHQEQIMTQLLFSQVFVALQVQKKGGSFVCKMFDSYTQPTMFILRIIRKYYKSMVLFKPESSRPANAEKYIVAYKFKGPLSAADLKILTKLHTDMHKNDPSGGINPDKYIGEIDGLETDPQFEKELVVYNRKLLANQKEKLREISIAIEMGTIYGPQYFNRQEQIAQNWCRKFDIPT